MTPYNKGYQSFFDGLELSDNPYTYGEPEYDQWRDGWKEAQSDDDAGHGDTVENPDDYFDSLEGEDEDLESN